MEIQILSVDWNVFHSALQQSREGHNLKALAVLSALIQDEDTGTDRAAIVLGEASCYSQLGERHEIKRAFGICQDSRTRGSTLMSQVALAEASLLAQEKHYDVACEQFATLKSEYHDLLIQPEHDDFALEVDSRLGCALVDARRYSDAIKIFSDIFKHNELEDKQRLQVFFGCALIRSGRAAEAQSLLVEAARGRNAELSKTASEYLAESETVQ